MRSLAFCRAPLAGTCEARSPRLASLLSCNGGAAAHWHPALPGPSRPGRWPADSDLAEQPPASCHGDRRYPTLSGPSSAHAALPTASTVYVRNTISFRSSRVRSGALLGLSPLMAAAFAFWGMSIMQSRIDHFRTTPGHSEADRML